MRVFISWSGDVSRQFAEALHDWLPKVINAVKPWFSEEDIEKGTVGASEIRKNLNEADCCIICLTPENLERPWINFEAGAIANQMKESTRVCPILIDLKRIQMKGPLKDYQYTLPENKDFHKLIQTINKHIEEPLKDSHLEESFNVWWEKLEKKFATIKRNYDTKEVPPDVDKMMEEMLLLIRDIHKRDVQEESIRTKLQRAVWEPEQSKQEFTLKTQIANSKSRIKRIKSRLGAMTEPQCDADIKAIESLEKQLKYEEVRNQLLIQKLELL